MPMSTVHTDDEEVSSSRQWSCDICKDAVFDDFKVALHHEARCRFLNKQKQTKQQKELKQPKDHKPQQQWSSLRFPMPSFRLGDVPKEVVCVQKHPKKKVPTGSSSLDSPSLDAPTWPTTTTPSVDTTSLGFGDDGSKSSLPKNHLVVSPVPDYGRSPNISSTNYNYQSMVKMMMMNQQQKDYHHQQPSDRQPNVEMTVNSNNNKYNLDVVSSSSSSDRRRGTPEVIVTTTPNSNSNHGVMDRIDVLNERRKQGYDAILEQRRKVEEIKARHQLNKKLGLDRISQQRDMMMTMMMKTPSAVDAVPDPPGKVKMDSTPSVEPLLQVRSQSPSPMQLPQELQPRLQRQLQPQQQQQQPPLPPPPQPPEYVDTQTESKPETIYHRKSNNDVPDYNKVVKGAKWVCDVCQVAKFVRYVDAYKHEKICSGIQNGQRRGDDMQLSALDVNTECSSNDNDEQQVHRRQQQQHWQQYQREEEQEEQEEERNDQLVVPKTKNTSNRSSRTTSARSKKGSLKWLCGVCEILCFDDYEKALRHEKLCALRYKEGKQLTEMQLLADSYYPE